MINTKNIAELEARATDLRQSIVAYEAQFKDPTLTGKFDLSAQYEALIDQADEEIAAIEAQLESREAEAELFGAGFIDAAPEMLSTIETLRCLLIKATSGNASVHDDGAFQDAIVRSGHLLLRAQGTDTTDIVARYEASLLEAPDDDDADDSDFGRYGRRDD